MLKFQQKTKCKYEQNAVDFMNLIQIFNVDENCKHLS